MKLASKLALSNTSTTALTVLLSKAGGWIIVQCKTSKMEEALMLAVCRHDQDKTAAIKSGSTHSVKDIKRLNVINACYFVFFFCSLK